jgi:hypothetical protein
MIDASKYFNAAVKDLSEYMGPMATIVVEEVFQSAKLPTEGPLTTSQVFVLNTLLRGELPKHLDTHSIVRKIEQAAH